MTTRTRPRRPIALSLLFLLAGIAGTGPAAAPRVRIVASLPNLGSIASAVAGDRIELTTIAAGTQDAHFVDPKPSYMVKLRRADVLLINGLDLEIGWIPPITLGARNPKILLGGPGHIDCSSGIQVVEVPATLSRALGDVHPYGNPHYLSDPLNAEIVAGTIADALSEADPEGAQAYREGRDAFVRRLHESLFGKDLVDLAGGAKLAREAAAGTLDTFLDGTSAGGRALRARLGGWLGAMEPVRGQAIVTYHKDLSYFAARFGLRVIDYVEPKPGIQPSPRHLEELVERLRGGQARLIITRPYVEHRSTDFLAEKTGVTVITLPLEVGGAPEATDYFRLFDLLTERIAGALAGAAPPAGG
jgi:ABC-type Zn uptake system ZnuABC Zn-binding protein ZnuA